MKFIFAIIILKPVRTISLRIDAACCWPLSPSPASCNCLAVCMPKQGGRGLSYSIVKWKWKSVSLCNCSSVSASSLPTRKKQRRETEHERPACPLLYDQPRRSIIPDAPHLTHYPRGLKGQTVPIPSGHLTLLNTTKNADDIAVA